MNSSTFETEQLLPTGEENKHEKRHELQDRTKEFLHSRRTHLFILFLVFADFLCVLTTIVITFLWPEIEREEHYIFEVLSLIAFTIDCVFIVEISLHLFAFGLSYYFKGSNWFVHLFDATVVIATFLLEIFLKGKDREAAGLLIIFRLWRLIKMLGAVAVGMGEYYDERCDNLRKKAEELEKELSIVLDEVEKIANEDMWDENRRARVFRRTSVGGSKENISVDVVHE
ncbi:6996_t:CDS:1 [Dentiscutata erythropus]|uniref:Voltage-gated hydrogen channel 1 n=1 Tax=Dentiscutata erythropus TaxID=1348616 RepID=A0A9N9HR33_9GLOM|nr:6996_t:CDS:1 [Dentiscutata erythropus]